MTQNGPPEGNNRRAVKSTRTLEKGGLVQSVFFFMNRLRTTSAPAAAPNSSNIGGAGTGVGGVPLDPELPELEGGFQPDEVDQPLDVEDDVLLEVEVDEDTSPDELVEVEEDTSPDDEVEVDEDTSPDEDELTSPDELVDDPPVDVDVELPPVEVEVDEPPVEVELPPVEVEDDTSPELPPDEVEVDEPPDPPLEVEVDPPDEVDEITMPLDPPPDPPKKPPAKNPPPPPKPPEPPTRMPPDPPLEETIGISPPP